MQAFVLFLGWDVLCDMTTPRLHMLEESAEGLAAEVDSVVKARQKFFDALGDLPLATGGPLFVFLQSSLSSLRSRLGLVQHISRIAREQLQNGSAERDLETLEMLRKQSIVAVLQLRLPLFT